MVIPDNEEILYIGKNQLSKRIFYKQGFIISLAPLLLFCGGYIFFRPVGPVAYFGSILFAYVVLSIMTSKSMYNNYARYFGSDEVALSKDKIYYNICMNIQGRYINYDDNRYIKDITEIYIRTGWNPKSLVIYFKDGDHIAIHSLREIEEVKKQIEILMNK